MDKDNKLSYSSNNFIGEGGFAFVFRGKFQGQDVAVKRIQLHPSSTGQLTDNEIEFQSKLKHNNILQILTWKEDSNFRLLILTTQFF